MVKTYEPIHFKKCWSKIEFKESKAKFKVVQKLNNVKNYAGPNNIWKPLKAYLKSAFFSSANSLNSPNN